MSQLLNRVRDVDPNDSEAVKEALTAFFQNLSKHKDIDCNRWLRALENVINRFPKYCGQHRATIENYLSHFLDSSNYYNVIEAAKCAHAVQQVRPQQEKTASAKSCWRDQMTSLCNAAHVLLDALFVKSASIYNKSTPQEQTLQTTPLQASLADIDVVSNPQAIADKGTVLCTRLRNVLVFIQAMLVEIYPVGKPIRPQLVLEVILHALSAPGNQHSSLVTAVKVQTLRTLDAIVASLGSNLVPFSALVFRVVMQTLRWSSDHLSEDTRKVRCAAYSSLTRWLNLLHVHRESNDDRARSWNTELTSHVVNDVTPPKHVIQLTANAQPMKNLSKKARKKLANSMLMQSNISSHMPGEKNKINVSAESNDEVAVAALECAESFLISCGVFLKPTTHKQFQELLVTECYKVDGYSSDRGLWLLRALEACRKSCSPKVPPPTQYCLQLYSVLVNSSQPEISKLSSQALLDIRLHLHCSPASLNFSLETQPDRKRDNKRKNISERNMAALESLLGKERLSSEKELAVEEIITIPDEPTSKRARTDEDDKISLSSESAESVEISDDSSVEALDDSNETDYIIEPELQESNLTELTEEQQSSQNTTFADDNDETDGQVDNEADNNTDTPIYLAGGENNDSEKEINIYEAKTQIPNVSNEAIEENSPPLSMEVAYDYPNTGQDKVTVLEKMDGDNLPSTNDTDDVQITCGQAVKNSQETERIDTECIDVERIDTECIDVERIDTECIDVERIDTEHIDTEVKEPETEVPKENGINKSPERIVENGEATTAEIESESNITSKTVPNESEITVADMLADFVDEVNESTTQA